MQNIFIKFIIMTIAFIISLLSQSLFESLMASIIASAIAWNIKKTNRNVKPDGEEFYFLGQDPNIVIGLMILITVFTSIYIIFFHKTTPEFNIIIPGMDMSGINSMVSTSESLSNIFNTLYCLVIIVLTAKKMREIVNEFQMSAKITRVLEGRINRPYKIKNTIMLSSGLVLKQDSIICLKKRKNLAWELEYNKENQIMDIITGDNYGDLVSLNKSFK